MRIGVMSRSQGYWATRQILAAAAARGHEVHYLNTLDIRLVIGRGQPSAFCNDLPLDALDVVIPRVGRSLTEYGAMVLRHLALMGVPAVLTADGLLRARNKFFALQALCAAGIPVPDSVLLGSRIRAEETRTLVPYPAILKVLDSTQGKGVMRVRDSDEASSIVDTMQLFGEPVCLQEYVPTGGTDLRCLVVGGHVVGAMKRIASVNEWRSNIHLGAKGVAYDPGPAVEDAAVRAAGAVGVEVAGVDLILRGEDPLVLEVNASPGFRGLLEATGVNAAEAIVDYAVLRAKEAGG